MATKGKYKISCLAIFVWIFSNAFPQESVTPEKKIMICHLSNDYHFQTLSIPYSALKLHLGHGDLLGDCSSENSPLKLSIQKSDVKCFGGNDGAIDLQIHFSHGKPPFNIQWSNGAVSEDVSNLRAGVYTVTVSIGNLSQSAEVIIPQPQPLSINAITKNISCAGLRDGEITVSPSGGTSPYTYLWSANAGAQTGNTANNLPKDSYRITVIDANGCITISDINVEEPALLKSKATVSDVKCAGGNDGHAFILPAGGTSPYSFSWSVNAGLQANALATNLMKGVYGCTVTDAHGCLSSTLFSIEEPLPLQVSFSLKNESCIPGNDGVASAQASGGVSPYSYQWSTGIVFQSPNLGSGLNYGTYSLTASDYNGCNTAANFSIGRDQCESMLRSEDCGATVVSLAQYIYCNPVSGATNYQWEFSNSASGYNKSITRGYALTNLHLTWVSGLQYGKTYDVRIKPYVSGNWKEYGPVCKITIPSPIPFTRIRQADCATITTSLNQQLFCDFVPGAQNYQWEFINRDLGYQKTVNRGSNSLSFTLGWVADIHYGKTYDVRVRANVGGEWGSFGDICQISLVYPIPVTKVRYYDCGITLSSMNQNIYCDAVAGASDYQWEITNSDLFYTALYNRNSVSTNFQFGWLSQVFSATTFNVRIRAKVAGEWAEFGNVCKITTPTITVASRQGNSNTAEFSSMDKVAEKGKLNIFPNPSWGEPISISIGALENAADEVLIEIFDMLGNKIFSKKTAYDGNNKMLAEINNDGELAKGIYILNVQANKKNFYDRIIVK